MNKIEGKNGIIFGSTGLIGRKTAMKLAKLDANLILQGTSIKKLKNLDNEIKKIQKRATLLEANVLNKEFYESLLETIKSRFHKIDILINLIGLFPGLKPLTHLSHKEWDQLIEINFSSYWRILKELEPLIRKSRNPKIITITNSEVSKGKEYHNTFSICKSGMNSLIETFRKENQNLKIKTYLIDIEILNDGMSSKLSNNKNLDEINFQKIVNKIITYCEE